MPHSVEGKSHIKGNCVQYIMLSKASKILLTAFLKWEKPP